MRFTLTLAAFLAVSSSSAAFASVQDLVEKYGAERVSRCIEAVFRPRTKARKALELLLKGENPVSVAHELAGTSEGKTYTTARRSVDTATSRLQERLENHDGCKNGPDDRAGGAPKSTQSAPTVAAGSEPNKPTQARNRLDDIIHPIVRMNLQRAMAACMNGHASMTLGELYGCLLQPKSADGRRPIVAPAWKSPANPPQPLLALPPPIVTIPVVEPAPVGVEPIPVP
jgi:hypothetical protein